MRLKKIIIASSLKPGIAHICNSEMVHYFSTIDDRMQPVTGPEPGGWVNIVPPLKKEDFNNLSDTLDIPIDFLNDSMDIDERSRYEVEDNVKLIVIKTPTENNSFNDSDAYYITVPIVAILTHNHILTINSFDNLPIRRRFESFLEQKAISRKQMLLKLFEKVVNNFMAYLKEINHRRNFLEQKLYDSNSNADLLELVRIQKSLVYFVTSLRSNELLMMKLERTNALGLNEDEIDHLNDIIVDNSQALEMANIYTNIVSSTLDAFAGIISINQNQGLKRLTFITIALQIPVLIASIYGMNVPLPFQEYKWAFLLPIILAAALLVWLAWINLRKFIRK